MGYELHDDWAKLMYDRWNWEAERLEQQIQNSITIPVNIDSRAMIRGCFPDTSNLTVHIGGEEMQDLIVTSNYKLKIKKVIYNDPATIILWRDDTKTVVKCDKDDTYDPEKGFLLCVLKKLLGNKGKYNKELKKWAFDGAKKEDE